MKFEIKIKEQLVNPAQLGAWKEDLELSLDYMYNLVDCMDIDYANRKPILEWIYQSLSFDNIKDCIKRLS